MIVFHNNSHYFSNKMPGHNKQAAISKQPVKSTRRLKSIKVTKKNKEFLRTLGFKI